MIDNVNDTGECGTRATMMERRRRVALILILIVDVAYVAWGAMAAILPEGLLGPGGKAVLPAAYEGYTGGSWPELLRTSPMTAKYIIVLYRMYGIYCAVFGMMASAIAVTAFRRGERWAWWTLLVGNTIALVSAMRMDWIVNAIGPFELTEYLGLVMVYGALAVTAPFRNPGRQKLRFGMVASTSKLVRCSGGASSSEPSTRGRSFLIGICRKLSYLMTFPMLV